jgi:hypothetical protein
MKSLHSRRLGFCSQLGPINLLLIQQIKRTVALLLQKKCKQETLYGHMGSFNLLSISFKI